MDQVNCRRMQVLFMLCILLLWGCSGPTNIYDLRTLPSHWRNYCCAGGDSKTGEFISSKLPLDISYDIGMMAGLHARADNPYLKDYLWFEERVVEGGVVGIILKRNDYLIVSFPRGMQNFFAKINGEHEIEYVVEFLIRYRRELLSVNYEWGTDCFLPVKHPTPPKDAVLYYECMALAKPHDVHYYRNRLGKAYLHSLLKGDFREQNYEFKGGSDFQVLAKVDSIATLLEHTKHAQSGAWMRGMTIHLIADYTLREKNLEAALNYLDGQLSKHAADTLLTPRLHQERQKLIEHTQEVKDGTYVDRSRISW